MYTARIIALARSHLTIGNLHSYRAIMSAALRRAGSEGTAAKIRAALAEDGQDLAGHETCGVPA